MTDRDTLDGPSVGIVRIVKEYDVFHAAELKEEAWSGRVNVERFGLQAEGNVMVLSDNLATLAELLGAGAALVDEWPDTPEFARLATVIEEAHQGALLGYVANMERHLYGPRQPQPPSDEERART